MELSYYNILITTFKTYVDIIITMKKYLIIGIILIICIIITGCISSAPVQQPSKNSHIQIIWTEDYSNDESITKIYISENNLTCYAYDNYYGGGISCLKNI